MFCSLSCVQTVCNDSQRRMDQWCNRTLSHRNPPARGCYGELRARHDRNRNSPLKLWRCFYESALTSDLSSYDGKSSSPCFFTKHLELRRVLQSCTYSRACLTCYQSSLDGQTSLFAQLPVLLKPVQVERLRKLK